MIPIYQFGTFDVANYGDLLFPLLAQKRLALSPMDLVPVSPLGGDPVWNDCVACRGLQDVEVIEPPAGILIGGGNIIHLSMTHLEAYETGFASLFGYPDLWIGASRLACAGVPVCWNAPGVPAAFPQEHWPMIRACLDRSTYLCVRDEQSRRFLLEVKPEADVVVCPDPGWDVSNLWADHELAQAFENAFVCRGREKQPRTIAVHVNSRSLASADMLTLASRLDQISRKMEALIILLAIGPCHRDDELARQISGLMETRPLLVDVPNSLREITACIALSAIYIGASMHGLIAASAFGVPGICVNPGEKTKFQELLDHLGREEAWAKSWDSVPDQVFSMNPDQRKIRLLDLRRNMQDKVNRHWEHILNLLQKPPQAIRDFSQARHRAREDFAAYRADLAAREAIRMASLYEKAKKESRQRKIVEVENAPSPGQDRGIRSRPADSPDWELRRMTTELKRANQALLEARVKMADQRRTLRNYHQELYSVYRSRSWRYMRPLRGTAEGIRRLVSVAFRPDVREVLKKMYYLMPGRIRNTRLLENMKNGFKRKETHCSRQQWTRQDPSPRGFSED